MRNKILAIGFVVLIFFFALTNVPNGLRSIKPLLLKYALHADAASLDAMAEDIDAVETSYDENFRQKWMFIDLHGLLRRWMGSQEVNGEIKLNNGHLTFAYDKCDVQEYSNAISQLHAYLEEKNINFIYVGFPYKISALDKELPIGVEDFGNENQDALLRELKGAGIKTFDLRERLQKHQQGGWYDAFFYTDHHWKPEIAFWAYTEVAQKLNEEFGYDVDTRSLDIHNYDLEVYDNFLGSGARRTGQFYAGIADDISIITPKWDTDMSVELPNEHVKREGTFADVMIDYSMLEKSHFPIKVLKENRFTIKGYASYMGGEHPLFIQKNEGAANHKKILVLSDSFSRAIQPYYSFMFDEVMVIDLRSYRAETLKTYIDRTSPDLVMIEYSPPMFDNVKAFEFGIQTKGGA